MFSLSIRKNTTLRLKWTFVTGAGAGATGLTPVVRIKRQSDGFFLKSDGTWVTPVAAEYTMTAVDATNLPGQYYFDWAVPNTDESYSIRLDGTSGAANRYVDAYVKTGTPDITSNATHLNNGDLSTNAAEVTLLSLKVRNHSGDAVLFESYNATGTGLVIKGNDDGHGIDITAGVGGADNAGVKITSASNGANAAGVKVIASGTLARGVEIVSDDSSLYLENNNGASIEAINTIGVGLQGADVADATWGAARSTYQAVGSFGQGVASVQGNVTGSVGSVAAGGITASSIAADAIGASELAADAVTEIATAVKNAVLDEPTSSHATAGTAGKAIADGAVGGGGSTSVSILPLQSTVATNPVSRTAVSLVQYAMNPDFVLAIRDSTGAAIDCTGKSLRLLVIDPVLDIKVFTLTTADAQITISGNQLTCKPTSVMVAVAQNYEYEVWEIAAEPQLLAWGPLSILRGHYSE